MTLTESELELVNRHGDVLYTTITWPPVGAQDTTGSPDKATLRAEGATLPLVILLHGFKGFRNWGFFPPAAQHLAGSGMIVLRMDFSQNGMRGTSDRVVSLPDFAANTITREIEDVADLIAHLRGAEATKEHTTLTKLRERWNGTLHIVGHSRGGGIAMLAGVEHDARSVVVWNSVGKWGRWTPRQREVWISTGAVEVENARTGQRMEMNSTYVLDIEANRDRYSLTEACRSLSDRLLFIHAEHDLTVPLKEIQALLDVAQNKARLSVVSNTSHTFGITHPFERMSPALQEVLTLTTQFLNL